MSLRSAFALSRQSLRAPAAAPALRLAAPRLAGARLYSAKADEPAAEAPAAAGEAAPNVELEAAKEKLEQQSKTIAELKVGRAGLGLEAEGARS